MLASPLFTSENHLPKEGSISDADVVDACSSPSHNLNFDGSEVVLKPLSDEYAQFQRRIFVATIALSAFAIGLSAIIFDLQTTTSLLVGAFLGVLYLRLLARSIEKLGKSSKQVSKIQLLIPVLLVLATSKLPQLELIPALLGFLLYKPSLILQTLLESKS